jgi:hypothetical protein
LVGAGGTPAVLAQLHPDWMIPGQETLEQSIPSVLESLNLLVT